MLYSTTKTKRNKRRLTTFNNSRKNSHRNHTKGVFYKSFFRSINRSLRPTGRMPQIILRLWGFLCVKDAGHSGNKIALL